MENTVIEIVEVNLRNFGKIKILIGEPKGIAIDPTRGKEMFEVWSLINERRLEVMEITWFKDRQDISKHYCHVFIYRDPDHYRNGRGQSVHEHDASKSRDSGWDDGSWDMAKVESFEDALKNGGITFEESLVDLAGGRSEVLEDVVRAVADALDLGDVCLYQHY